MRLFAAALLALAATQSFAACNSPLLDKTEKRLLGKTENLCETYGGKVLLVVNTASKCGFTPQYEGLEALYKQYKDKGLVVLGFPSDQFLGQEYDDDAKIAEFCKANYGVSFPMYSKGDVKGDEANPLFKDLIAITGEKPSWNFNKYLIGRDGKTVTHFGSKTKPQAEDFVKAIEAELAKSGG
jgi:glutathione peroxidase